jgi:hypothetical protein
LEVLHGETALDLELSLTRLEAHDVGDDLDAFDFLATSKTSTSTEVVPGGAMRW